MAIAIPEFTIAAYDEVLALWRACEGVGLSEADSRESIARYLARNPGMGFIALDGEKIVGAVLCGHDGRRGYIHHLAVHPDYRRRGVGRALAQECLDALRAERIGKCHLFVLKNNAAGARFWKSAGWTPRADISIMSRNVDT